MTKTMSKLLLFLATTTMMGSLTSCQSKNALDDGVLTVGYTIYAPMNYFNDNNEFVGFDTELAQEVGKLLNVQVEFKEINWDNKILSLNSKEIDCVWNGMTITDELKEAMAITDPYLENKQVVVCQTTVKENYDSKEELANASEVLVEAGSAGEAVCVDLGLNNITTAAAQKDTLLEVKTSASKIAVIDETMAKVLTGEGTSYADLTYNDVGFDSEEFGIGFRKDDAQSMQKVNNAINLLKDNGTFNKLMAKYFA